MRQASFAGFPLCDKAIYQLQLNKAGLLNTALILYDGHNLSCSVVIGCMPGRRLSEG
jgi:hypothetical protein